MKVRLEKMTSTYSIRDLEQLSGIKAHTIRAWEQRFKLIEPKRTNTNIRFYNDGDLRVVLNTSLLISTGMKIGHISKLNPDQIAQEALNASPYLGNYQYELNELKLSTLNFDVVRFDAVMATCIDLYGVHATFQEVIGDFIQELGKLWLSGCVGISQEHFMSSLLRQKLFAAIDNLETSKSPKNGTFALFLPANELHEIGILYLAYVLKERGEHVFYLGQSLPKEYLVDLVDHQKVDYLVSAFTTHPEQGKLDDYLDDLDLLIGDKGVKVYLTGYQFQATQLSRSFKNISIYSTLKELSQSI